MNKILILLTALFSPLALAQSCQEQDQKIAQAYTDMVKFGSYGTSEWDKFEPAYERFYEFLPNYLAQPDSVLCNFAQTKQAGVKIRQSDDKKIRTFSWDQETGGTLHEFDSLWQYQDQKGNWKLTEGEGQNIIQVFTANLNDKTYYWLVEYGIAFGRLHGTSATLYQIKDELEPAKLIKTSTLTHQIGYSFDPSSEYDLAFEKRNNHIRYDEKNKVLSFPVIIQTKEYEYGKVTKKRIRYQFNGEYFVRQATH